MSCDISTSGNGLSAQYQQQGHGFTDPYVTYQSQVDSTVDIERYCARLPNAPISDGFTNGIWTGWIVAQYSETVTFTADPGAVGSYCNANPDLGAVFLSIDSASVINVGGFFNANGPRTGTKALSSKVAYPITITRSSDTEDYYLQLLWQSASQSKVVVPQSALFTSITPTISSFSAVWNNDCGDGTVTFTWVGSLGCLSISGGVGSVGAAGSGSVTVAWDGVTTSWTLTNTGLDYISGGILNHQSVSASASITPSTSPIAPNVLTGTVTSWNSAVNYTAGRYRVAYRRGAYKLNPNAPFGVQYNDNDAQIDGSHGFYVTDGAGNVVRGPGNKIGYQTQGQTETGNAGAYVYYDHAGGAPIGIYLYDGYYPDNVAGSPSPTFSLCGPLVATLTATSTSIDVGDSSTLTWASTNADSATDPVGGTTTSGSQAVSPTSTTSYTFDATGFAGNIEKAVSVTVTVNPPTAATSTSAVGSCGGTVALSWSGATHTSSYIVERSADGSTGWSQIAAQAGTTYTDTPPSPGVLYYYRVKSVKGSVTSAASAVFAASTILAAPTPAGFTVTAHGNRNVLAWTAPAGYYGTLTVNVYEGTTSGAETLLTSGLAVSLLTYVHSGLQNGTTYYYRLSFTNDCGEGSQTAEASGMPLCGVNLYTDGSTPSTTFTPGTTPAGSSTFGTAPSTAFTAGSAVSTTFTDGSTPSTAFVEGACPG